MHEIPDADALAFEIHGAILSHSRTAMRGDPGEAANVGTWLRAHADARPAHTALIVEGTGERISYAELEARVNRAAAALAGLGVVAGDRVALALASDPLYLELYFAAALLGAILIPLNTRLTAAELGFQIDDSEPRVVVRTQGIDVPARAGTRMLAPDELRARMPARAERRTPAPGGEAPQVILYTSGTTGRPKGAVLPHRKTYWNSRNAERYFALVPDDVVVVPVPLFHSFGLKILSVPTLFVGATVLLVDRFDPIALAGHDRARARDLLGAVPFMYERMLEAGLAPEKFASLRSAFSAGAALAVETIERYGTRACASKQGYGQTETSILCCLDAARRAAQGGLGRQAGRVRRGADRRRARPRRAARRARRGRGARPDRDVRLLAPARGDRAEPDRRLAPHRRSRRDGRGRLRHARRPAEGALHQRRRERVPGRGRARARATPGRVGGRGGRRAGREVGRSRAAPTWCRRARASTPRACWPGRASGSRATSSRARSWSWRSCRAPPRERCRSMRSWLGPSAAILLLSGCSALGLFGDAKLPEKPLLDPDRVQRGRGAVPRRASLGRRQPQLRDCHPGGGADALVYRAGESVPPGTAGGCRTLTLRGLYQTAPYFWDGSREDARRRGRAHARGRDARREARRARTARRSSPICCRSRPSIAGASSPTARRSSPSTLSARRGHAVFAKAECVDCHPAPAFTRPRLVDIGSGGSFAVPTLRGVPGPAPWGHDGRWSSLEDAVRANLDAGGVKLGADEIAQLLEYLKLL